MVTPQSVGVLFVCTGNICRSPTADGVFRKLVADSGLADRVRVDSAGTIGYHAGSPPDERAIEHAARRGYDLTPLRARRVTADDFATFDLVLAMDEDNHDDLRSLCPPAYRERLRMFLEFAPGLGVRSVPDPYYGGGRGFEHVLDLVETGCRGLLAEVRERLG
ncbi:MAG: low molecular weight phosphotyrosine protein phosphatase [Planctomycetes bacterium]|nr:low molecular weight phosphotyrosine protein phosphatase [Planctomycetota bacterium]